MKFLRRLFSFIFRLIILIFFMGLIIFIFPRIARNFRNTTLFQTKPKIVKNIEGDVKEFLIENYKGYYDIDNFKIISTEETARGVEFTTEFNMTLKKSPKDLPFVKSFREAANTEEAKSYAKYLENYVKNFYNKKSKTTLVFLMPNGGRTLDDLRFPLHDGTIDLSSIKIDEDRLSKLGTAAATNFIKEVGEGDYNGNLACDYALKHYKDEPEYENNCANFVSTCINEGGIDETGSFHPGAINWITTGFKNDGSGLVPYLTRHGYFYQEKFRGKVEPGSIVYWTDASHVGLITYQDTVTMKYTAHTKARKNEILPLGSKTLYYVPTSK